MPSTQLSSRRMWWVAVVCGAASLIDSVVGVAHAIALVIYQQAIGLQPAAIGLLAGVLTFGIATGALVGGRLGDRFGRKPVFQLTMFLLAAGSAAMILSVDLPVMVAASAAIGLAAGADLPVSLATVAETAGERNRGALIGLSNVLWQAGIVIALVLSTFVAALGRTGAQALFGLIFVLAVLVFIARLTVPESNVWRDSRQAETVRLGARFSKRYLMPLLVLAVFYGFVNLGTNTVGQFNTFIWVNVVGISVAESSIYALICLGVGIALGFVFMRFADTPHRFRVFLVGAALMLVGLLLPAVVGFSVPTMFIGMLLTTGVGTALALEGPMKLWTQESFPTAVRSTAQGTIIAVARYIAGIAALFTPTLLAAGPRVVYLVLAVVVLIGYAVAIGWFRRRSDNEFAQQDGLTLPSLVDEPGHEDLVSRRVP